MSYDPEREKQIEKEFKKKIKPKKKFLTQGEYHNMMKEFHIQEESWKVLRPATGADRKNAVSNIVNRIKKSYWL